MSFSYYGDGFPPPPPHFDPDLLHHFFHLLFGRAWPPPPPPPDPWRWSGDHPDELWTRRWRPWRNDTAPPSPWDDPARPWDHRRRLWNRVPFRPADNNPSPWQPPVHRYDGRRAPSRWDDAPPPPPCEAWPGGDTPWMPRRPPWKANNRPPWKPEVGGPSRSAADRPAEPPPPPAERRTRPPRIRRYYGGGRFDEYRPTPPNGEEPTHEGRAPKQVSFKDIDFSKRRDKKIPENLPDQDLLKWLENPPLLLREDTPPNLHNDDDDAPLKLPDLGDPIVSEEEDLEKGSLLSPLKSDTTTAATTSCLLTQKLMILHTQT